MEIVESARNVYSQDLYAIYLRKSRADLDLEAMGEGETLARHKTMLYDLAARHGIHPDQIVIYEEVVSGESIEARPKMQQLLNDVYQKKFKGVLVVEVERLARGNTKDQGEVADAFQYSGTHIITPSKVYDPNNEFDQEYFEFGLFMSRREYKTIKRRMEAGRVQSFREGNYVGSTRPYGYNIKRVHKKERILVINEAEAPVVKMIFDWWTIDRMTPGQIAKKLTEMQIPTKTGNKEWNRGTIGDILTNTHCVGKVRWNKRKTVKEYVDGKMVTRTRRTSVEEYEECPGKHEAIISQEQFDLAQTFFTNAVPVKLTTPITNPLAGILVCCDCGKTMAHQSFKSRPNTAARFTHRDYITCSKKSCPAPQLIDALVDTLKAHIQDFEFKMQNNGNQEERIRHQAAIETMEAELAKQERKRSKLFDKYEDDVYTKEEFIERKQKYNQSIEELKKQIQDAKAAHPEPVDYSEKIATLHQMIEIIRNPEVDAKATNDFLKRYIEVIKYDFIDYGRNKGGIPVLDVHFK